jgi:hypothetical protein
MKNIHIYLLLDLLNNALNDTLNDLTSVNTTILRYGVNFDVLQDFNSLVCDYKHMLDTKVCLLQLLLAEQDAIVDEVNKGITNKVNLASAN